MAHRSVCIYRDSMAGSKRSICAVCGSQLLGRQRAFCSRHCKNRHTNHHHQSYIKQVERARVNKLKLITKLGGRCGICGYDRNLAALEFHHRDPALKCFQLDARSLANRNWMDIELEAAKCDLLCSNCHAEHHNPGSTLIV